MKIENPLSGPSTGSIPFERAASIQGPVTYDKVVKNALSPLKSRLESIKSDLRLGQAELESWEKAQTQTTSRERFARAFSEFLDEELPGSVSSQAKILYYTPDTLRRIRRGESRLLTLDEVDGARKQIEAINGRPVSAEGIAKVLEAHGKAREIPRTPLERLKAAQQELEAAREKIAHTIERDAALVDRIDELQNEIKSLEAELAAILASGGCNDPHAQRPSDQDPATKQRELELRRRVEQAKAALSEALEQKRENDQERRELERSTIEAVHGYLSLIESDAVDQLGVSGAVSAMRLCCDALNMVTTALATSVRDNNA